MPFRIKTKLTGIDDALKALEGIKQSIRGRILRQALGEAGKILLKAAKSKCPKRTGLLRKSLGRKVKSYKSGVVVAIIGPRTGFRKQIGTRRNGRPIHADPVKYAHLVEFGTQRASAKPFLRPAYDASRQQAFQAVRLKVREGILKEAEKARRKAARRA